MRQREQAGSRGVARLGVLAALLLSLAWMGPCRAQQPTTEPVLKLNPLTAMREFEEPANEEYRLGRGDEISIDFAGRPEMNGKRTVGPDGRITLAPAGSILVADKTREQAAEAIATAFSSLYTSLSVTVGVDRYTSNRLLVLGAVEHPGVVAFDQPPTLLEVLTRSGGIAGSSGLNAGNSGGGGGLGVQPRNPAAVPERCAIYRGSDKVLWVDLKDLLDSGSALADIRLRRDDVVYIPAASERYVSVLGQVQHPGALELDHTMTLPKLLAEAGGLTQQAGKNPDIHVIQPATGKTRVVPFKRLLEPGTLDLTLQSGDVIYVGESGFNQLGYVLETLSPLVTMFTAAVFLQKQ